MLVADPSSRCDVCYGSFSEIRECYSIPCGHVFCYTCLERLPQRICPICRTPVSMKRIRKIHVDMSKSLDRPEDAERLRHLRELEEAVASEALDSSGLTVQGAYELRTKLRRFFRKYSSPHQHILLRSVQGLLAKYASAMAAAYEESSNARATKASYEDRIKELEQQLKDQTRTIRMLRKTGNDVMLRLDQQVQTRPHTSRHQT